MATVAVVIEVAADILTAANDVKSLTSPSGTDKLNELVAQVTELNRKIDELKKTLDFIAQQVQLIAQAIDWSRQETFRVTLWGAARVALINMKAWRANPQKSLGYIQHELVDLMNATQDAIAGGGVISINTMGLSMAAQAAIFALLFHTDQKPLAKAMCSAQLRTYRTYFQDAVSAAASIESQAHGTQADLQSQLNGLILSVAPHPNAPPPGPYIASEPRNWRDSSNCLEVLHCSGSLTTGFNIDAVKSWTRITSIHPDKHLDQCESDGNELGNDFPLTTLDKLNTMSRTYINADKTIKLMQPSQQAATVLAGQADQLLNMMA